MKNIFIQLCIACLALTARAQETKNQQVPLRTNDPALRRMAVNPVLPIKSGGGNALRQLVVLKGHRYVSLGYMAPADAMRAPEAERFFRSLRLLS